MRIHKRDARPHELEVLDREPERDPAMSLCIEAYAQLSSERSIGMVAGPVPWSAIVRWARFHGLDYENAEMLIDVIFCLERKRIEREESARKLRGG